MRLFLQQYIEELKMLKIEYAAGQEGFYDHSAAISLQSTG
jgi:hypothetical protein